jgi:YesN/AraC family two-component response regulator
MKYFSVEFNLRNLKDRNTRLPFRLVEHIGVRKDLTHLFHELIFTWIDRQNGYIIKTRAFFMLILHRIFEIVFDEVDTSIGDFRILKILRHIKTHYAEKITVKEMAALTNLNTVYFGALFKQKTGMTLNQYLIKLRFKNAKIMLQGGGCKVLEVAEQCGYKDIPHFYKQFKQIYGFPPSECIPKKIEF